MPASRLSARSRLDWLVERTRNVDLGSLTRRARAVGRRHHRPTPVVLADMLLWSTLHDTGFQDYVDWDYAILSRSERGTFLTNGISNHIAMRYNDPAFRGLFEDKIAFDRRFDAMLHRAWLDVRESDADALRRVTELDGVVIAKQPVSNSGSGVSKYRASEIDDWEAFRRRLVERGEFLAEEHIVQHPELATVAPGVVNTTRVTTFLDGEDVHVLSFAQKFGVGTGASDQQQFGGFFTLLDEEGRSLGPGYGSHQHVYATHPETGASITDFRLPMADRVLALAREAARVVPEIRYVGWDVVVRADRPVLLEGNWMPGAYENKPTATGRRTGSLPRFREVVGF